MYRHVPAYHMLGARGSEGAGLVFFLFCLVLFWVFFSSLAMLIVYQSHEVTQSLLSTLYLLGSSMLLSSVHPVNSHSFSSFGHMLKLSGTLPDITRHSPILSMCCLHAFTSITEWLGCSSCFPGCLLSLDAQCFS